jgi:hypothetical protein
VTAYRQHRRNTMKALLVTLAALLLATPAAAQDPGKGTWSPDGIVCRPGATPVCRYVAPGCELVRIMDDRGPGLSGTRYEVWCRPPRNAV